MSATKVVLRWDESLGFALKLSLATLLLLTACSAAPAPSPTPTWVAVSGDAKTGTSGFFIVGGSGFTVDWTLTAPPGGCQFRLLLATPQNPQGGTSLVAPLHLREGKQSGGFGWEEIGPGTFILQEERNGPASCTVPWSGKVTSH